MKMKKQAEVTVFTIGHSTIPVQKFLDLLKENAITMLIDIRTIPRSRHNPQFNQETLPLDLKKANIEYRHMKGLGGLRHAGSESRNTGWKNAAFRGFADYMGTEAFLENLEELLRVARNQTTAIMCAEAVPWRCHRSLIADSLLIRGIHVQHILSAGRTQPHRLTPFAKIEGLAITYPSAEVNS